MFIDQYQKVHCVGIGGIGISAIAKFFVAQGKQVTGSDANATAITADLEARGIKIFVGHDAKNVAADVDLLVYSEAVPEDSPERVEAQARNIPQLGHFDFLGALSKEYRTICLTGTNGKSTTTAMTGLIFEAAGLDPTVFVGSLVPGWVDGNVRIGKSDILIIEGDEYKQKMVKLFPETTVITNIEEDHLDVYKNLKHIVETFRELAKKTTGKVIANADDKNCRKLKEEIDEEYGVKRGISLRAKDRKVEAGKQTFEVMSAGKSLGRVTLQIPGEFNMMNALAAAKAALTYEVPFSFVQTALANFTGVWRRFERVGQFKGADVISDYGHHPTAIKATLEAAKEFFPDRRIVLLFEPHQHSRTKELFDDFTFSFDNADEVILSEIYAVEGRLKEAGEISSMDLVNAIGKKSVVYAADLKEAEKKVRDLVKENDVVIVMGAGDVDRVARNLIA